MNDNELFNIGLAITVVGLIIYLLFIVYVLAIIFGCII